MTSSTTNKEQRRQERLKREQQAARTRTTRALRLRMFAGIAAAVAILGVIFATSNQGGSSAGGKFAFQVGRPGPGQPAPAIDLAATQGGTFSLAAQHGKTTLLYFQEGLTCQPCWDQLKDLDTHLAPLKALGIDQIVTITTDPLDALRQKASDEGLTTPVLSDLNLTASQAYAANQYGMMGNSRDGHSFVVVGPNGTIRWRADYGGAPNYTMYVPVPSLLADIRKGLRANGT